jgi:hypothetical protein
MDDLSELNLQRPKINMDKRFSNPDPNYQKIKRTDTLNAGIYNFKNNPNEKQILIKQLT